MGMVQHFEILDLLKIWDAYRWWLPNLSGIPLLSIGKSKIFFEMKNRTYPHPQYKPDIEHVPIACLFRI
jgi:hypothetical protein